MVGSGNNHGVDLRPEILEQLAIIEISFRILELLEALATAPHIDVANRDDLAEMRRLLRIPLPLPPTPMQAMFSTSFGPTPPAHPCRPLAKTPNPATEAPYRNDRRLTDAIMAKFYSVSLECPIATRHSFNDQMGEPYGCILRKPFPPCHIPARDANIKKIEMFLLRIMIGSILGVIRLGCLQQCLGDSSNGRTYGLPVGSARYGARCWAAS